MPGGTNWDAERCNWNGSRVNCPNPVGIYPHGATPDGLHEMAGNVYEWTSSLYRDYPCRADDGREIVEAEGRRIARGGSWSTGKERVRCAYRGRCGAWEGDNGSGFRLTRTSL